METVSYCDWGVSKPLTHFRQDVAMHIAFEQAQLNDTVYCIKEILRSSGPSNHIIAQHETYIGTPYDPHVFISGGYHTNEWIVPEAVGIKLSHHGFERQKLGSVFDQVTSVLGKRASGSAQKQITPAEYVRPPHLAGYWAIKNRSGRIVCFKLKEATDVYDPKLGKMVIVGKTIFEESNRHFIHQRPLTMHASISGKRTLALA